MNKKPTLENNLKKLENGKTIELNLSGANLHEALKKENITKTNRLNNYFKWNKEKIYTYNGIDVVMLELNECDIPNSYICIIIKEKFYKNYVINKIENEVKEELLNKIVTLNDIERYNESKTEYLLCFYTEEELKNDICSFTIVKDGINIVLEWDMISINDEDVLESTVKITYIWETDN